MAQAIQRRGRITIIDDHPEFLDLMQELLSTQHDVTAFSGHGISPDEILDSRPDLLIVDLRLDTGDLQGIDIVTLARAHRYLRTIPIIVCSADALALNGGAEGVLRAGNTTLLTKPFSVESIERIVSQGLTVGFNGAGATGQVR